MTDKPEPDQSTKTVRPRTFLTLAVLFGASAGFAGVYLSSVGNGKVDNAIVQQCTPSQNQISVLDKAAQGELAAFQVTKKPLYHGDLAFKGPNGNDMTLADFKGKSLLVNIWATWCGPCRREMPGLNAVKKDLGGDTFDVVTINIDTGDEKKPKAFLKGIKADALVLYRDTSTGIFTEIQKRGRARGLPTTLLLDKKGCEMGFLPGPAEWHSADALRLLKAGLGLQEKAE